MLREFIKKEAMLVFAVIAAVISLIINPPDAGLFSKIDWKTLATLFMLLSVLDGFKSENLFLPIIRLTDRIHSQLHLCLFLVFGVFFSSMFVTNDVSLIIFVPLTIMLFRKRNTEQYILPILTMENIAAIRGSLLTPFGSPQNLFLFGCSDLNALDFMLMMLPLWLMSIVLIIIFLFVICKNAPKDSPVSVTSEVWKKEGRTKRVVYLSLFLLVIASIVTRTSYWPLITAVVVGALLIFDRKVFQRVDYALLGTFLCFFIFSSSLTGAESIAGFLRESVGGAEYYWSIGISQIISNVPAAIVLQPFSTSLRPLIYGLDTAGLVSIIGSLASVINLRIYTREYPGHAKQFMIVFEKISLCFFMIVFLTQFIFL